MSTTRSAVLLGSLVALVSGCFTLKLGKNEYLSPSTYAGMAFSVHDKYTTPPAVDPADFQPPGHEMTVDTHSATPAEINFALDLREALGGGSYVGITSTVFSFYLDNSTQPANMYSQRLRYSTMNWWDQVMAEDVAIRRSPSLGLTFGLVDANTPNASKFAFQFATSVRWYELDVNTYRGVDCHDCTNTSTLKNRAVIASGVGWQNALEFGLEEYRLRIWFELDGSTQATIGFGIVITDYPFRHGLFGEGYY